MVIHIREKKRGLDQLCFPQKMKLQSEGKVPYTLTIDVSSGIQYTKNKAADVHSTSSQ